MSALPPSRNNSGNRDEYRSHQNHYRKESWDDDERGPSHRDRHPYGSSRQSDQKDDVYRPKHSSQRPYSGEGRSDWQKSRSNGESSHSREYDTNSQSMNDDRYNYDIYRPRDSHSKDHHSRGLNASNREDDRYRQYQLEYRMRSPRRSDGRYDDHMSSRRSDTSSRYEGRYEDRSSRKEESLSYGKPSPSPARSTSFRTTTGIDQPDRQPHRLVSPQMGRKASSPVRSAGISAKSPQSSKDGDHRSVREHMIKSHREDDDHSPAPRMLKRKSPVPGHTSKLNDDQISTSHETNPSSDGPQTGHGSKHEKITAPNTATWTGRETDDSRSMRIESTNGTTYGATSNRLPSSSAKQIIHKSNIPTGVDPISMLNRKCPWPFEDGTLRERRIRKKERPDQIPLRNRLFSGCSPIDQYNLGVKLGQGTFGEVKKATQFVTGVEVALKKVTIHEEKDGMPITAIREIKLLKRLRHPSIVPIIDMAYRIPTERGKVGEVYMVEPYMDHDLNGMLENPSIQLNMSQIKLYMKQLFEGTLYLHQNQILHRDMKAANLLINNKGQLQIADFGLARPYRDPGRSWDVGGWKGGIHSYTGMVVTRWYRPPELLAGDRRYGPPIDMWGLGCILAEMVVKHPIFKGSSEVDQMHLISQLCGSPDDTSYPGWNELPGVKNADPSGRPDQEPDMPGQHDFGKYPRIITDYFTGPKYMTTNDFADLIDKLLVLDPCKRLTAKEALEHRWFWSPPYPADPASMPVYQASKELDRQKRDQQKRLLQQQKLPPSQMNGAGGMYGGGPSVGRPQPMMPYANGSGMAMNGRGRAPYSYGSNASMNSGPSGLPQRPNFHSNGGIPSRNAPQPYSLPTGPAQQSSQSISNPAPVPKQEPYARDSRPSNPYVDV